MEGGREGQGVLLPWIDERVIDEEMEGGNEIQVLRMTKIDMILCGFRSFEFCICLKKLICNNGCPIKS